MCRTIHKIALITNLTQSLSAKLGAPDWNNAVNIASNLNVIGAEYTPSKNGYIFLAFGTSTSTGAFRITINNFAREIGIYCGTYDAKQLFIPVKKGDVVKVATFTNGFSDTDRYFLPCE